MRTYKRHVGDGFEFLVPQAWLRDQTLVLRGAVARTTALDPPDLLRRPRRGGGGREEPAVAYGPPGSSGEVNVSVVAARAPLSAFRFEDRAGAPAGVAALLQAALAPPGRGRVLEVSSVQERGAAYYTAEFSIALPGRFERHNVSTFHVTPGGRLFTLNVQAPEALWRVDGQLREWAAVMAGSLLVDNGGGGGLLGAASSALQL